MVLVLSRRMVMRCSNGFLDDQQYLPGIFAAVPLYVGCMGNLWSGRDIGTSDAFDAGRFWHSPSCISLSLEFFDPVAGGNYSRGVVSVAGPDL